MAIRPTPSQKRFGGAPALAPLTMLAACSFSGAEYLKATSQLGGAVTETAIVMPDDLGLGAAVCRRSAELDFAQHHLELPRVSVFEWGTSSDWSAFYKSRPVDDTSKETWEAHCKVFDDADHLFEKAMGILGEYGSALTTLAASGSYDGADVQGDASSAGDLATKLGATTVGKDLTSIGGALAKISQLLFQKIVSSEARNFIVGTEPSVALVLKDLRAYMGAVQVELLDERSRVKTLFTSVEARVAHDSGSAGDSGRVAEVAPADGGRGPDRLGALGFGYVAHELVAYGDRAEVLADKLQAVLDDLARAHSNLAAQPQPDLKGFGKNTAALKKDTFRISWREWR